MATGCRTGSPVEGDDLPLEGQTSGTVQPGGGTGEPVSASVPSAEDEEGQVLNLDRPPGETTEPTEPIPSIEIPHAEQFSCLLDAYPEYVKGMELNSETGELEVVMHDGTRILWDDGDDQKTFEELLNGPDLQDTLSIPYPLGRRGTHPDINEDPGRIRSDPFLVSIYGRDRDAVRENTDLIDWMPRRTDRTQRFNTQNGALEALRHVSDDLEELCNRREDLCYHVTTTAGTFVWREIRGTSRLSAHSFAIAIDINTEDSDYWRWRRATDGPIEYRNSIPLEIVDVFEHHQFIWGGKWYHYDTMHFEYRPELFHEACSLPVFHEAGAEEPPAIDDE